MKVCLPSWWEHKNKMEEKPTKFPFPAILCTLSYAYWTSSEDLKLSHSSYSCFFEWWSSTPSGQTAETGDLPNKLFLVECGLKSLWYILWTPPNLYVTCGRSCVEICGLVAIVVDFLSTFALNIAGHFSAS